MSVNPRPSNPRIPRRPLYGQLSESDSIPLNEVINGARRSPRTRRARRGLGVRRSGRR